MALNFNCLDAREEGLIFLGNGNDDLDGLRLALEDSFSAVAESLEKSELAIHFLGINCSPTASFTNLLSDSLIMAIRLRGCCFYSCCRW